MESVTKNQEDPNEIVQIDEKYKVFLEFENITCILYRFIFNKIGFEKKEVLKGVSGCFKPGEFTGILGPSGAGKTTLLNILSGYSTFGAKGTIKVNGVSASASKSSNRGGAKYIRQEDDSRTHLTLYECMYFAAALKLAHITPQERHKKIIKILKELNICESQKTLYPNLSGGEKRRLAVSLELLSDPALIFFDEPTTGLDSVASNSLVKLLSKLAKGGRTIIATIQQPSALLLEKIDRIYCLAEGRTFYDAPRENIIPALNYAGLFCPPHHNPADFLIEIASAQSETSIEEAASGMLQYNLNAANKNSNALISTSEYETNKIFQVRNEASYLRQTMILIYRSYLIAVRNYKFFLLRTFAYLLTGFLTGQVYPMAGSDASTVVGNVSSIYSCSIFVIYAALMYVTLTSNLETEILKGEHFNKWYHLGPYMISFLSAELPFQVIVTSLCGYICYWLTGNPLEYDRVLSYLVAMLLMTLCSLSWGFFLGSTVPIKIAVFIGPMVTTVYSLFAFSLTLRDTPYPFRWVYHISYFRAGCHIAINAIYGNVTKLPCSKEYCHFMAPQQFLKEMDVIPIDVTANIALLVLSSVFMLALTYLSLYLRLNKR